MYNISSLSDVLYVGTTFTDHGDYRHDVPALSSRFILFPPLPHPNSQPLSNLSHARNLYDLNFAEFSFSKQSLLRIDIKYRDHFLVDYIHGFNSSTHVYFVTVQRKNYLPGNSGPY